MEIGLAILCALVAIGCVLWPFFGGAGGLLQASAADTNLYRLLAARRLILERYVQDEAAAAVGEIAKVSWHQRRNFLTGRYIDVTRRIEHISTLQEMNHD